MPWIAIILLIIVLDQVSKFIITKVVDYGKAVTVINNFFYITHSRNKGAAWGIFQNGRFFFIILTIIILAVLAYIIVKSDNKMMKISLSMIIGGAAGNFIDRARVGSVVDFLDFYFGSYNFPTFNVADSFIVIGTIILAYYLLTQKDKDAIK